MDVESRVFRQPVPDFLMLVRSVVVEHEMDVGMIGDVGVDG